MCLLINYYVQGSSKNRFLKPLYALYGTVSTISSDLTFIEWHVRFTTIHFKPLCDQGFRRYSYLYIGKISVKKLRECTLARSGEYSIDCTLESLSAELNLKRNKWGYQPQRCPDKGLKGTVVNRTCLFINGRFGYFIGRNGYLQNILNILYLKKLTSTWIVIRFVTSQKKGLWYIEVAIKITIYPLIEMLTNQLKMSQICLCLVSTQIILLWNSHFLKNCGRKQSLHDTVWKQKSAIWYAG